VKNVDYIRYEIIEILGLSGLGVPD